MPVMDTQVVIDGNNLLHAMHAHAPLPAIGRETLVRIIERWAERVGGEVVVVEDRLGVTMTEIVKTERR